MTADISAQYKLGISLALLSTVVASAGIVVTVVFNAYNEYLTNMQITMSNSGNVLINDLRNIGTINGASAYKFVSTNEGIISSLNISYSNGDGTYTFTADYKSLLHYADRQFELNISNSTNDTYKITLMEVSR